MSGGEGMNFITFEGINGSGKTLIFRMVQSWMKEQGFRFTPTMAPGGTKLGYSMRRLLFDSNLHTSPLTDLFLYSAVRSDHTEKVIRPALERGEIVLCDRYTDSTLAYQGHGHGLNLDLIRSVNLLCGAISPTLTIWLDVSPKVALGRVDESREIGRLESMALLERARKGFKVLSQQHPERFRQIDANKPIDVVFELVIEEIKTHLQVPANA